jgi:hypothetical protein
MWVKIKDYNAGSESYYLRWDSSTREAVIN